MAKLTVQLVTWNGAKYIPFLFESLRAQTCTDWELQMLDNASSDGTKEAIETELVRCQFPHVFEKSTTNIGFAGGHNVLYKKNSSSDYVLLLNQDMYLMPDCLEHMVDFLDLHPQTAAVSPRLMRWHFNACRVEEGVCKVDGSHTDDIDALGLKVFRNRRVVEQYTKQSWQSVKMKKELQLDVLPVFGVSGAFPMYRRSALKDTELQDGEFFDGRYHSYKEDVDLAYRLRSAGYESFVLLNTIAYHDRSGAGPKQMSDRAAVMNKRTQSRYIAYHSYKNHLMTLYKNEYLSNLFWDLPFIFLYEFKKFIWFLCLKPSVLFGLAECFRLRRRLSSLRTVIAKRRRVDAKSIRSWWRKSHIYQESFGVIPVYVDEHQKIWFLLVLKKVQPYWDFPKGRPEVCETAKQSALRELEEETGISSVHLEHERPFMYDFIFDGGDVIVHKTAFWFVGTCASMETVLQVSELSDRVWLQYADARKLLTHENAKCTLDKAYTLMTSV